ncbi:MAG: tRNA pseudouridine(55) synthase TruB [Bacteroidales bacterium]|nr:tRNA pseudouridine(55) synthase TruB [Bacteroidales bacterium]
MTPEQIQAGIVLPVDKPRQWTSFQAVAKIKAILRHSCGLPKVKIGHAGTLDPLATGLLLVCIGRATKSIPSLQDADKVYTGTLVLGATTPCHDLERPIDRYYPFSHITLHSLQEAARGLTGPLMQAPPIFSAVKIEGKRAYELARADTSDEMVKPKAVLVHSFEITDFRPGDASAATCPSTSAAPSDDTHLYSNPQGTVPQHLPQADFRIACGKGTYIRSLARDLGTALGSGAFLTALRREQIGTYSVDKALKLEQVESYLKSEPL